MVLKDTFQQSRIDFLFNSHCHLSKYFEISFKINFIIKEFAKLINFTKKTICNKEK